MSQPTYGAIGTDEEEAVPLQQTKDTNKDTPQYRFMAKVMGVMAFLCYDPLFVKNFFDDPDQGLTATIVASIVNMGIEYYWYTLGGSTVKIRILSVIFFLSYGPVYLVTREQQVIDNTVLRDHLLGDWLEPISNTIIFILGLAFWKLDHPFVRDYMEDSMEKPKAQLLHPVVLHAQHVFMILWLEVFFAMFVFGWWTLLSPDDIPSYLPLVALISGFVGQNIYTKHLGTSFRVYMDRFRDPIAEWNSKFPDVDPPWALPRE